MSKKPKTIDLTVLALNDEILRSKPKKPFHPNLPDIGVGACVLLVAPPKSGKGVLINNLLLNENFFDGQFDEVYYISSTIHTDSTARFIAEKYKSTIFDEYDDKIVDDIIKYQQHFKEKDKMPKIAVVADDFIGLIPANSKIFKLSSKYRHYNIKLLLYSTQMFKSVPPVVRTNATYVLLYKTSSDEEITKLIENYATAFGGKDNFLKLYHYATKEKYNFLFLNIAKNPVQAFKNFTELIYTGE